MERLKNTENDSGLRRLCPVTMVPLFLRPEWTDVSCGEDYRVTISLLGDSILLIQPCGFATLPNIKQGILLTEKVIKEELPEGRGFILIEDLSNLIGISRSARKYFIDDIKKHEQLRSLVFYGASAMFKLSINLARRVNVIKFNVTVVNNYSDAVKYAHEILSNGQTQKEDSHICRTGHHLNASHRDVVSHKSVTHPDWYFHAGDFSLRYEVINANYLNGITDGMLKEEHSIIKSS